MLIRQQTSLALTLLLALLLSLLPSRVGAQSDAPARAVEETPPSGLTVRTDGSGMAISLQLDPGAGELEAAGLEALDWPTIALSGYELPVQLITVLVDDAAQAGGQPFSIRDVRAEPWRGKLTPAAAPTLPDLPPDEMPGYLLPDTSAELPDSPVFVLRDGRIRGQHVRVLAVSPVYHEDGQPMLARSLDVTVPNATPLTGDIADLLYAQNGPVDILADDDLTPPNGLATGKAVKLLATEPGLQVAMLSELQAAGLSVGNHSRLGVMRNGVAVPRQIADGALFFYAEAKGDYWNESDVFWITDTGANVANMATRTVAPAGAPLRSEAYESGSWQNNQVYASYIAGGDGDHWFASLMQANSEMTNDFPFTYATLAHRLPLSGAGELTLQARSTTTKRASYDLRIDAGVLDGSSFTPIAGAGATASLDSSDFTVSENEWITEPIVRAVVASDLRLTLMPPDPAVVGGSVVDSFAELYLDEITWRQRVALNFRNGGAVFDGADGTFRYRLRNVPAAYRLFDVTDPSAPVALTGESRSGTEVIFQDGPGGVRRYLVATDGNVHRPPLVAHNGTNVVAAAGGAHLLYIAPASLHATLQQLTDFRREQNCPGGGRCQVRTVDVQEIYDAYSFGSVSPEAIRQYLRYAVVNWNPAPISVVLVGDGTQDPKNYEGHEQSPDLIPPYLAYRVGGPEENIYVDPFIRRTGCENCYGQLDGVDPLVGDEPVGSTARPGTSFFPDIMVGRLPVKNAAELRDLIAKMIRYESEYDASDPRNEKLIFLADNFIKECDPNGSRDTAGDFATYSNEVIGLLPDTLVIDRVYYDPTQIWDPTDVDGDGSPCNYATPASSQGYREGNPMTVYEKVQRTMQRGAGLVTYNGHASQWRWAVTDRDKNSSSPIPQDAPEHLFYIWDVLSLNNSDAPFISLAMSCLTSQFHTPVDWGMTIDEHLLLRSTGGAAATWGSTGLSVAQGHFALERGFHKTLWGRETGRWHMGELVMGGYLEQYSWSGCCDDVRRTFMLMGDPMMRVRAGEIEGAYLPLVAR
jgi:hypothetical protein